MQYRPEADLTDVPHVVVDGAAGPTTVLTISHWPGTPTPEHLWADTSAEMVLRYLDAGGDGEGTAFVTNDHFDQDGTAGLFALTSATEAAMRRELLADLARAGDFATYRYRTAARASMALSAMAVEAEPGPYPEQCAALYTEALGLLPELLDHPDRFRRLWADEDADLTEGETAIAAGRVAVREIETLDLAVITLDDDVPLGGGHRFGGSHDDGLHPMALHSLSQRGALLVSHGHHHRFGYRYESWVQYRSRRVRPRVELAPLADELTSLERDGASWTAGAVAGLTVQLGPAEGAPSSLTAVEVETALVRHLGTAPPAWDPFDPQR